ncbi:MAG: glycosyltransferase family 2 protein [Cyanobacteria bacterium]|nr:glycosyltransferase family 2 protein [Cyanobacteriota bacterium]MDW8200849.1 glycosyltransferase family 2 protein [Cyanobacteriota bacterium SKYGB_h_bin112]
MPENSWSEETSYSPLESLDSLLPSAEEPELSSTPSSTTNMTYHYGGRRRKAALVLIVIWSGTIALHFVSWSIWLVLGLTTLMSVHALRIFLSQPAPPMPPLSDEDLADVASLPYVSLLVAAKNEEAVIGDLVKTLCTLDYPQEQYELWVIDDNSSDRTPDILKTLTCEYPQLHVLRRGADATGGKSGALNQALPLTKGDIIAVFDADAHVSRDLLRRVLPLFRQERVGAVQVRKAIVQAELGGKAAQNLWIQGQSSEMLVDSFFQEHRIAIGGTGELRGNGQFLRRTALESCGGWNEETITDDLDLTIRLHLNQWDINVLSDPPVLEEGVTRAIDLWHQRNRWGEGGYQRYLDYWQPILQNRMGTKKTIDLAVFWISQYFVATSSIPDLLMSVLRNRLPIFTPITILTITLSVVGMFLGYSRQQRQLKQADLGMATNQAIQLPPSLLVYNLLRSIRDTIYMCHWFLVMATIIVRISIRPKQLKWVKTVHQGVGAS